MKKNKNTKYRNERVVLLFPLTVTFCLACAACNIWLFVRSFNQALYKINEKPIATITFKYRTAQRKFLDRVVWDRLREHSPVYDGDTIRTAPLSEATVWFSDGNKMELYENTMAQVFLKADGLKADLASGGVTVDSAAASGGMTLSSGKVAVKVASGSAMSASSAPVTGTGGGISLQVIKGTAAVSGADNTQQTLDAGNAAVLSADGTTESVPSVIVTSPEPNAKLLYHTGTPLAVDFKWKTNNIPADTPVILEVSGSHDFSGPGQRITVTNLNEITVLLEPGTKYWRIIRDETGTTGTAVKTGGGVSAENTEPLSSGKLQILQSLPPACTAPATGYVYRYRTQKPAVRFIWSESAYATSYELTAADNQAMQNPAVRQRTSLPSSIISSLGAGTWYWQVTPYYTINGTGLEAPSSVGSFTVQQRDELLSPALLLPEAGSFVNTKKGTSGTAFSWQQSPEAEKYILIIADNKTLSHPFIKTDTDNNYCIIHSDRQHLKNGMWYWTVTQTDNEGNISPLSEVREFVAVDGEVIQKTLFPPDLYVVSSAYVQDMRFTWKTDVPFPTRMQISRDSGFTDTVYDSVVNTSALEGRSLGEGTYYWRIKADTEAVNLVTPAKTLTVVGPLPAPVCTDPAQGARAVIRPAAPYTFTWTPVEGADYYKLLVYKDGTEEPVFEQGFIRDNSLPVNMEHMEEGKFRWTVQPFANETELSSRRTGLLGESSFDMKKLRPVKLVSPEAGTRLDGIRAILTPGTAVWSTVDRTAESEFILTETDGNKPQIIKDIKDPPVSVPLGKLDQGTYSWTVKARTYDDLDISAPTESTFTVLPVPPLSASGQLHPAAGALFDAAYLRTSRTVVFSWQPVADATDYIFTIRKSGADKNHTSVFEQNIRKGTTYTLEDLAVLDRGTFIWSVEAVRRIERDSILQHGTPAEGTFTIDIPVPARPVLNKTGILYGN